MNRKQKKVLGWAILMTVINGIFIALGLGISWEASGIVFLSFLGVAAFYGIIILGFNLIMSD